MYGWRDFCIELCDGDSLDVDQLKASAKKNFEKYGVYPDSIHSCEGSYLFMVRDKDDKKLIVIGESPVFSAFSGEIITLCRHMIKVCPLIHANCNIIRQKFSYTVPSAVLSNHKTLGLGDRLGLASAGHIRLIKKYNVKPMLAQQSIRELNLTGRTYEGVLDDSTWAVFQEGYSDGYGADGDHLKKPEEVRMALDCGFTMITLDCSEHIDNSVTNLTDGQVNTIFNDLDENIKRKSVQKYLAREFVLGDGTTIKFSEKELKRIILTYKKAIDFTVEVYNNYIKNYIRKIDFEMSIDETMTPTSPQSHYWVASELTDAGVKFATLAPRFCGEFQKGIDYIGDITRFESEFKIHAAIADDLGYKISVHSGSDKFSVFPVVGRETKGKYHIKTAGTNWLEAIRVIAAKSPDLYREIHKYALSVLSEAQKYYHIGADVKKIPDIDSLSDADLPGLMDKVDSRQVIHITYGLILQAKNQDGLSMFRDRIYKFLHTYEEEYYAVLYKHIGKHLSELGE